MRERAKEPKSVMDRAVGRHRLVLLVSLMLPALAAAAATPGPAPSPTAPGGRKTAQAPPAGGRRAPSNEPLTIVMHEGIPAVAFIGQTLGALRSKFPKAEVVPFAKQNDVATVRIPEAGISCQVAGASRDDLRVVSVGFNLSGEYQSFAEGNFRTDRGIGRGSTVNDLLGAYGRPSRIKARRPPGAEGQPPPPGDPEPSHYVYDNADASVATDFVIVGTSVARIVVNDLVPLRKYLVKEQPGE